MKTRAQIIFSLENCCDADADRINNRLQQCNVRILRTDGTTDTSFDIRTRLQLAYAMKNDQTIEAVQYHFNNEWITASA